MQNERLTADGQNRAIPLPEQGGYQVSLDGRPVVNNKLRMKKNGYGATGDIYACSSLVGDNDFYIGNVFSGIEASLVEKTKSFIAQSMEFCRQCDDFKRCGGGCFARWYGCEENGGR